jgi:hypothetical protein
MTEMTNAEMILGKRLGPYRKSTVGGFDLGWSYNPR